MNTENFEPLKGIDLKFIEDKQQEIKFRYEPNARDLFNNFDIDTYEDQEAFKRYAWRITEEICEALEDTEHIQHFKEEITDAFNFLIELYHLYGWRLDKDSHRLKRDGNRMFYKPNKKEVQKDRLEHACLEVIKQLGLTCNILKNRQWRQSQYLVDLIVFEKRLNEVYLKFRRLLAVAGISEEELFEQWSLKYQVNCFRLDTQY